MMPTTSQWIQQLRGMAARTEKESLLQDALCDAVVAHVFWATYNPFIKYGVVKTLNCDVGTSTLHDGFKHMKQLLDVLAKRELTGNAALLRIREFMSCLTEPEQEVFRNILDGDQRCGVSDKTLNKVRKGLIPTFEVMLATQYDKGIKKIKFPCMVEPKLDGLRCLAIYDGETVEFVSRSGKKFNTLDHLYGQIIALAKGTPAVFDGEVMGADFLATMSSVRRKEAKDTDTSMFIFDVIPYDQFVNGVFNHSQQERSAMLRGLFETASLDDVKQLILVQPEIVQDIQEAQDVFAEFLNNGFEGAILKNLSAAYQLKRSGDWVKMKKHIDSLDLEIVMFIEGTGKNVGKMGTMVVDYEGIQVGVGTGFTDEQRQEFWNNRGEMIGQIVEIEAMEQTPDGSLRHPAFVKMRSYKGAKA